MNKRSVESMFDSIAWRYDFLNHFLSFGIDRLWRRKAIKIIESKAIEKPYVLDVATGTGDLALEAIKLNPVKIIGIDISNSMLSLGNEKIKRKGLAEKIELRRGNSEEIPFEDSTFDVAMVAFGVRNFSDPLKGLAEMRRVLRNEGMIMVLEFSKPKGFIFKQLYYLYFKNILPFLGKIFSNDKSAYSYLPESVIKFPDNEEFVSILGLAGFADIRQVKLSFGIASIYTGINLSTQ